MLKTTYFFLGNYPLVASVLAILLAQAVKIPLHYLDTRRWDWSRFFGTGGMPSSHSAGVTSLASAIGWQEGVNSALFAVSVILGVIVMYDAMGIRRHAGEQAMAINKLKALFDKHLETDDPELSRHFLRHKHQQLKELLGHQPIEVAGGAAFGVAVGLLLHLLYV
ncbi:MAG TPA: divergent PAP2 family protein [Bacilli bacterium]|nr:divergent PAP2 family protein [Bacilli bacterium]